MHHGQREHLVEHVNTALEKRYGKKMAHRYIISFTKSAQHVADVFELALLVKEMM